MTEEQKSQIKAFRNNGLGYKLIAKELGISVNSVKSFCRRNELCAVTPPKMKHRVVSNAVRHYRTFRGKRKRGSVRIDADKPGGTAISI